VPESNLRLPGSSREEGNQPGAAGHRCPTGPSQGIARPAMGKFVHEAAAVDPVSGYVYLTEDEDRGRFYASAPQRSGILQQACSRPRSWRPAVT
jgi:Bacterial protein of unknown function (DUF839)